MKILAVGDIHCKTWIIDSVEDLMLDYDHVVFCGDYVDNWGATALDSLESWNKIHSLFLSNKKKVTVLLGNHDYAYLHDEYAGRSSGFDYATQVLLNSPENSKLKKWLLSLSPVIEIDGITFSHAGIAESWSYVNGTMWSDNSPIWMRPGNGRYKEITQVFGHTPSKSIWNPQNNAWSIDTFSEHRDGTPYGDQTALEIIDAKEFNRIKLNKNENNNSSTGKQTKIYR